MLDSFYGLPGMGEQVIRTIGIAQGVTVLGFVLCIAKTWTYGAVRHARRHDFGVLERLSRAPNNDAPVPAGSNELAGTNWRVIMMDGSEAADDPKNRYIRFSTDRWQATVSCATLHGSWTREGDRLKVGDQIVSTEQNCLPDLARIDGASAELMKADPRFLVGPSGELLITGGGHALTGGRID